MFVVFYNVDFSCMIKAMLSLFKVNLHLDVLRLYIEELNIEDV